MVLETLILHCLCVHLHIHLFIHWFICPPWTGIPLQFNSATWKQEMGITLHLHCSPQDLVYRGCSVNVGGVDEWSHDLCTWSPCGPRTFSLFCNHRVTFSPRATGCGAKTRAFRVKWSQNEILVPTHPSSVPGARNLLSLSLSQRNYERRISNVK